MITREREEERERELEREEEREREGRKEGSQLLPLSMADSLGQAQ